MIVRVLGEGQYDLAEELVEQLNALDRQASSALDGEDEAGLEAALREMVGLVRSSGRELPDDEIVTSSVVLPPPDLTLEEARKLMSEEGFIPDPPTPL